MTIIDLKNQIMHNELGNFYVFTGEEIGIVNIYLNQMSKVLNMPITRADSVAKIYSQCTTKSMFGNTTGFYVIRDDKDFPKEEKAWLTIEKDIGKNVIVLLYDKIDSRLKFGKHYKDKTIQFEKLAPNVLKTYVQKAINLSNKNIDTLIELCNGSYDLCMLEIDKIQHYSRGNPDKAFEELLECGVIYQPEESDVFKFTGAVCNRNKSQAFELSKILLDNGSSSINLLGTLYNSMKTIMLIQCCDGASNVTEITGLDNKQIYFNKKYCGKYRTPELVNAVKLISKVIAGVKSGWIDDVYAVNYTLCNIM